MQTLTLTTGKHGYDPGAMANDALIKYHGRTVAAISEAAHEYGAYITGIAPRYRDPEAWGLLHEGARLQLTVRTARGRFDGWFVVIIADQDEIVLRHG